MVDKIRLAVVDDHPLMRVGIEQTLKREPDFNVVAVGSNADDALRIAAEHAPHLMLLDVNMPGGGLNAARDLVAKHPEIRLLVLTVSERQEDVTAALDIGVRGYILKGIGGPDLVRTIRTVFAGETYITPEFAARLLASSMMKAKSATIVPGLTQPLTAREEQVLKELSLGATNKEIARTLSLTEKTVKHYMSGILQKLSARNRVEAIVASRRLKGEGP